MFRVAPLPTASFVRARSRPDHSRSLAAERCERTFPTAPRPRPASRISPPATPPPSPPSPRSPVRHGCTRSPSPLDPPPNSPPSRPPSRALGDAALLFTLSGSTLLPTPPAPCRTHPLGRLPLARRSLARHSGSRAPLWIRNTAATTLSQPDASVFSRASSTPRSSPAASSATASATRQHRDRVRSRPRDHARLQRPARRRRAHLQKPSSSPARAAAARFSISRPPPNASARRPAISRA